MQSFPDDKGATARPAPQHTSNFAEPVPSRLGILLAGLMLDVLHHDRACSYPGLSSHSIGLLQVLNNLRSFKHGHTSIGILHHHASKFYQSSMATLMMQILFMQTCIAVVYATCRLCLREAVATASKQVATSNLCTSQNSL